MQYPQPPLIQTQALNILNIKLYVFSLTDFRNTPLALTTSDSMDLTLLTSRLDTISPTPPIHQSHTINILNINTVRI